MSLLVNVRRAGGFTLVEILVTLAIIGLMAALFLPRMSKPPARAQPEVVKFLAARQVEAVRTRKAISVELRVEPRGQVLHAGNGREFRLAEGERMHSAHLDAPVGYLGGIHVVTFFTDGSTTAGEWLLIGANMTTAIRFSPFASRIGYAAVAASTDGR